MDRNTITAILICAICFFGLNIIIPKFFPPIKVAVHQGTNAVAGVNGRISTNQGATVATAATATTTAMSVTTGAVAQASAAVAAFATNAPEQLLVVSNTFAQYVFTSRGGGLKAVDLVRYPEAVSAVRQKKAKEILDVATLNENMPVPVGALVDDGTASGDGVYQLTQTATGVRAEKTLSNGLSVVKTFTIGTNYLLTETVRLENGGTAALALPQREVVVGSAVPGAQLSARAKSYAGQYVGVVWYDGAKMDQTASQAWFANVSFMSCLSRTTNPRTDYFGGSNNVVWVAARNQFFTWIGMPESPAAGVAAHAVDLPRDQFTAANAPAPQGFFAGLVYPAVKLAPGQAVEQKLTLFAGPKEYRTLAAVGDQFKNNADQVMGFSGFLGGFARGLLLAMNWLHDSFRLPYGWAIIAITVILKLVFWPLTAAGTRSMKRMSALQPQMKAIQEKYKDDPAKMNKKTMEFMKEHKINPVGGCLPMLIQMPILFGFYRMIQSAIELRGAPFLWIGDLTQPDTLFVIPGLSFVPFFSIPGVGLPINILPIIMVGSQIWQAHLTPPSPGMDPGQQKMMRYMPLMFLLFMYNMSAGLTLYWTVSNLLSILQTKMTKTDPNDPLLALHPAKKDK